VVNKCSFLQLDFNQGDILVSVWSIHIWYLDIPILRRMVA